ncbi:MAG TPA: hypothetical protein VGH38_37110 [Bryobacteraceae bacterium]
MKRDPSFRADGQSPVISVIGTLLRFGFLLCLAAGTYFTALLATADFLSRTSELTARQHAVRLFASPTLYDRLADKREESGDDPLPDLEEAARLDPENATRSLRLGLRAELSGDFDLAERSLLKAAAVSRLYQPRYLLAQYYFRRRNADHFWGWSRAAFATAPGDITPLLDLCWRMQPDAERLAELAPPGQPGIAGQFLLSLARHHETRAARSLASTLSAVARPDTLAVLLEYCNQCLREGDGVSATEVWNSLCRRRLLPDRILDPTHGVSLTNARFEHAPAGTGFDWLLGEAPWLGFRFDKGMQVTLTGNQPERCPLMSQYVPVLPGMRYTLGFASPPVGSPSSGGLEWMVCEPSGKVVATQANDDAMMTFTPQTEIVRVDLFYQRPLGSTRLNGTISIAGVRLEMKP